MTKRTIKLEGTDISFPISKVVAIKADIPTIFCIERLPDGSYKLIFNAIVIPDMTVIEGLSIIRED
jgi:hypothetical protein